MSPHSNHSRDGDAPPSTTEIVRSQNASPFYAPTPASGQDVFGESGHPADKSTGKSWSPQRILRYKWSILIVAVLLAGPAITAIWLMMAPQYAATGQVLVRPTIQRLVFRTESNGPIPLYSGYLSTQVNTIQSPAVLTRVLEQKTVQDTKWYQEKPPFWQRSRLSKLERIQKALKVQTVGQTQVIAVRFSAPSPSDAATIANEILRQYIAYGNDVSGTASDETYRLLAKDAKALSLDIEGFRHTIEELQGAAGTINPDSLADQTRTRLDDYEMELAGLERTLSVAKLRHRQLTDRRKEQTASPPTSPGTATGPETMALDGYDWTSDAEWRRLNISLRAAEHNVKLEEGRLGEEHPTMNALRQEVAFARANLAARVKQLRDSGQSQHPMIPATATPGTSVPFTMPLEQQIAVSANLVAELEVTAKLLRDDIQDMMKDWKDTFGQARTLERELALMSSKQELYGHVTERLEHKRMESKAPGSIRIQSDAMVPSTPSQDRRLVLTVLATLVATGAGLAVAFLRAGADPAIYEVEELNASSPAPFLGSLPRTAGPEGRPPLDDPFLKEGIRMVRTPLLQHLGGGGRGKVLLVTSASPGEGKTTVSILLARSLAQCGKKVLLVDGDLRNPNVSKHLGLEVNTGLMESLSHKLDDSQVIVETENARLSVLPAGQALDTFNPELIANGVFTAAIDRWRDSYDVVLLDSSPVLPVADARILAHHADGTLLVVWAERTRRTDVVETMAHLNAAGGQLWGTVLIDSSGRRNGYGTRYGYGDSYNYGPYGANR